MPYVNNKDTGEDEYVTSIYAKEELPTWNELYNEFWLGEVFSYDPDNPDHNVVGVPPNSDPVTIVQHIDMFWKLPHRKLLLGWVCNQLNKMIFEDNQRDDIIDHFSSYEITDIRFVLLETIFSGHVIDMMTRYDGIFIDTSPYMASENLQAGIAPAIITCELPSTNQRSLFASNYPSVNIKDLVHRLELVMITKERDDYLSYLTHRQSLYQKTIGHMLRDVARYFEGDTVGWKDDDGIVLPSVPQPKRGCDNVGVDPAL